MWKEFDLRGTSGRIRQGYEDHHKRVSFPEAYPVFQGLQVDLDGNLWVLRYEPPWSTEDYRWDVFSREGEWIAVTSIPFEVLHPTDRTRPSSTSSSLMEIGEDYVLIRHQDDLGVERVRRHFLRR
jgi:hypothetical protein